MLHVLCAATDAAAADENRVHRTDLDDYWPHQREKIPKNESAGIEIFLFVFGFLVFGLLKSEKFLVVAPNIFRVVFHFLCCFFLFFFNSMPTLNIFCTEISDDAVYLEYQRLSSDDTDGKQIFVVVSFKKNSSVKLY